MDKTLKNKSKTNLLCKFVFIIVVFFAWAGFVNAQIVITEIMYDLEGADANREWIEIYNDREDDLVMDDWRLCEIINEKEVKHYIYTKNVEGEYKNKNIIIPAKSFAIIVDDPSVSIDFSGLVLKSAFSSLKDKGQILVIKDFDLREINKIDYSKEILANHGNSLQLINGNWIASSPTPGFANVDNEQNQPESETQTTTQTSNTEEENNITDFPTKPQIFADAGKNRSIIVGADTMFAATAFGVEKQPLQNARYSWSFGDGGSVEGQKVLYAYKYPSKYVVVLNVSSGEYTASDRIVVEALPADIVITEVNQTEGFIELYNRSGYELDLSWWRVRSGNEYFSLPKDTIILQDNKIRLYNKVTKFSHLDSNQTYLLYPNGEVVNKYNSHLVVFARNGAKRSDEAIQEVSKTQTEQNTHQTFSTEKVYSEQANSKNEENQENEDQLAFVGNVIDIDDNNGLFNKWTFSLLGLVFVSVVGVLFTKGYNQREEEYESDEGLKPEDFKIIE